MIYFIATIEALIICAILLSVASDLLHFENKLWYCPSCRKPTPHKVYGEKINDRKICKMCETKHY